MFGTSATPRGLLSVAHKSFFCVGMNSVEDGALHISGPSSHLSPEQCNQAAIRSLSSNQCIAATTYTAAFLSSGRLFLDVNPYVMCVARDQHDVLVYAWVVNYVVQNVMEVPCRNEVEPWYCGLLPF